MSAPSTEMPRPILEIRKPTPEDQSEMEAGEEKLLQETANLPPDSPALFGKYGVFAMSCQERGVYAKAEKYFKKAFALGPVAYKTYDFSKTGDFEQNYINMLNDIGRYEDSEKFAAQLWEQQTKVLGPVNEQALYAGIADAQDLGYISKPEEKKKVCLQLIKLMETNGKENSDAWVQAMITLGESYQALNQMHDAKVCYQKALAVDQKTHDGTLRVNNLKDTLRQFDSIK